MSGNEETFIRPAAVSDGAARLAAAGESLSSRFGQLSAKITGLNNGSPWGDDQPGKEFNKNYLEGGAEAPALTTLDAGKNLVERMSQLGPDVKSAVEGTVEIDDLVKQWFGGDGK
jgi:hypothetical protein